MGFKGRKRATTDGLSQRWIAGARNYCAAINAFVAKGETEGWDAAGPEPSDGRSTEDAAAVVDIVRRAQGTPEARTLRERFPPGFAILVEQTNERGRFVGPIVYVEDDTLIARVGDPWADTQTWELSASSSVRRDDILIVGRSPKRKVIAVGGRAGISLSHTWNGETTATLPWPNGSESVPDGVAHEGYEVPSRLDELIPLDDGRRAVLVAGSGVFLLEQSGATLLCPDEAVLAALLELHAKGDDDKFSIGLRMQHAAVSPDGSLIAVGAQDGKHLVLDDRGGVVGRVGPHGEYPHHAVFTADGSYLAVNACHFYNGATVRVATSDLQGMDTEFYAEDPRVAVINSFARVYASASRDAELFLGDAYGYLHGVGAGGAPTSKHFVGGNITSMDISPDGRTLAVATVTGTVHLIELDAGEDPFRIGRSNHLERRRWLMWKGEERPLCW